MDYVVTRGQQFSVRVRELWYVCSPPLTCLTFLSCVPEKADTSVVVYEVQACSTILARTSLLFTFVNICKKHKQQKLSHAAKSLLWDLYELPHATGGSPVSQLVPVKPGMQVQVKLSSTSAHVALF